MTSHRESRWCFHRLVFDPRTGKDGGFACEECGFAFLLGNIEAALNRAGIQLHLLRDPPEPDPILAHLLDEEVG